MNIARAPRRSGFSLIELLVVISVAALLAGLLMPALAELRVSANRVVSASNLRQIGIGMLMYVNDDVSESLPYAAQLWDPEAYWEPGELSAANLGKSIDSEEWNRTTEGWTGLGLLWHFRYCRGIDVFYSDLISGLKKASFFGVREGMGHLGRFVDFLTFDLAGKVSSGLFSRAKLPVKFEGDPVTLEAAYNGFVLKANHLSIELGSAERIQGRSRELGCRLLSACRLDTSHGNGRDEEELGEITHWSALLVSYFAPRSISFPSTPSR